MGAVNASGRHAAPIATAARRECNGKDPSKVDRSAAYATRHIAKNMVASGLCSEVLVQVSYAIGVAEPMGVFIDTYGSCPFNLTDGEMEKPRFHEKVEIS